MKNNVKFFTIHEFFTLKCHFINFRNFRNFINFKFWEEVASTGFKCIEM